MTLPAGVDPFQLKDEAEETPLQGHLMAEEAFLLVLIPGPIHSKLVLLFLQDEIAFLSGERRRNQIGQGRLPEGLVGGDLGSLHPPPEGSQPVNQANLH